MKNKLDIPVNHRVRITRNPFNGTIVYEFIPMHYNESSNSNWLWFILSICILLYLFGRNPKEPERTRSFSQTEKAN